MPILRWALGLAFVSLALAQDPLQSANQSLINATHQIFGFTFEERTRWEQKDGVNFGSKVNQQDMLSRLRPGAWFRPTSWLEIDVMGQDSRVPFYGLPAPNTMGDSMDLQVAYLDFFGRRKSGFGAIFGRQMVDYGEARLIGSPQWSNVSRTYDTARLFYRTSHARFEILMVSPVEILTDRFNRPDLGQRIWGTYNVFGSLWHGASVDAYALRHSQNRIAGFTGAGTLGTDTYGGRFYGPMWGHFAYSLEAAGQTGHIGLRTQRAFAWFAGVSRPVSIVGRQLNFSGNFKVASGTKPGSANGGTYDQLSPANHDKFGHEDLFGWRNLKSLQSIETYNLTKSFAWNLMYTNHWLYSATDALYNSTGASLAASSKGIAGTHVGQELDTYLTWKHGGHTIGAGFGHFFRGEFIAIATPHINPRYFYIFQQYTLGKPR